MQTAEHLRQLYNYNEWANREFLTALTDLPEPSADAVRLFAHLLLAEKTWLQRMRENSDTTGFDFWAGRTVADCEMLFDANIQEYERLFLTLTEETLELTFSYRNSKGAAFTNTYREALTHVFMHSSYHRGQVAQAMRRADQTPPYTDYVQYLR